MKYLFTFLLMGLVMNLSALHAADFTLNATIANVINTSYNPPFVDPPDSFPGSLTQSTELQAPATVDTTDLSGQSIFQVLAPANSRVSVTPVAQGSGTSVDIWLRYLGSADIGITIGEPSITYTGLQGVAPTFSNYSAVYWSGSQSEINLRFTAFNVSDFSFTSIIFTQAITGTANPTIQNIQTYNFIVSDGNYYGAAPPNNPSLFTITPVPEPSAAALFGLAGGVAMLRYLRTNKTLLRN